MIPKAGALPKQERGGTRCTQEALCELPWGAGRDWEAPRTLWPRGESTWEGQRAEVKGDRDGSEGATSLTGPLRPQAGEGPAGAARCPVSPWVGPWSTKAHSLFHLSRESRSWPRRSAAAELFQGLPAPRVDFNPWKDHICVQIMSNLSYSSERHKGSNRIYRKNDLVKTMNGVLWLEDVRWYFAHWK